MRSLFLKELHQGRPLLIFSLIVGILLAAAYLVLGRFLPPQARVFGPTAPGPLDVAFAVIMLIAPLLVALFAGAGIFAGESDHNTVPVLLALPLSRRRIWLSKVLAGLTLTALGAAIILVLGRLLLSPAFHALPVSPYLPDLCFALLFVFAVAAFMSSITTYFVAALIGSLLVGGALGIILGVVWSNLGGELLGYNPILDAALWGLLAVPSLLLGSALAITRGELLQSLRKHAFAIPGLVVGLLITMLIVSGVARVATRYSRAGVRSISTLASSPGSPVLPLIASGDPVAFQRGDVGKGWERRPFDWEPGQLGDTFRGPLYRSTYGVALDLRTGRGLLHRRTSYADRDFRMAISPDGRCVAIASGPAGLTWGRQSWKHFPEKLEVYDLAQRKRLFAAVPDPLLKRQYLNLADLKWSPRGDYLAFTTAYSGGESSSPAGFFVMRPDGSRLAELAAKPAPGAWFWSPSEDVIYVTDRSRLYRVTIDGRTPQSIWTPGVSSQNLRRQIYPTGISPDGRWIVLSETRRQTADTTAPLSSRVFSRNSRGEMRSADRQEIPYAVVRAVSTANGASQVLWSASEHGGLLVEPASQHLAWSPDGRAFYALLWTGRSQAQLLRWHPGEPELAPIGPRLPYLTASITLLDKPGRVLVYPGRLWGANLSQSPHSLTWQHEPSTAGPVIIDRDGRLRPFPSAADAPKFADDNVLVTIDPAGRLITLTGPPDHQSLAATDLTTARSTRLYP